MKKILIVKTSSLGDIVHNFPAVTDVRKNFPNVTLDWLVEEKFASLAKLHEGVDSVLTVSLRRWRSEMKPVKFFKEVRDFFRKLRVNEYSAIVDTQGLFKSAILAKIARGKSFGLDLKSSREPVSYFYDYTFSVPKNAHAIERNRQLVSQSLGYHIDTEARFGLKITSDRYPRSLKRIPYAILIPFTSNDKKRWKFENWISVGNFLNKMNLSVLFIVGNTRNHREAQKICRRIKDSTTYPISKINEITDVINNCVTLIGVDTGLTHLALAIGKPTIGIFSATDPAKTGLYTNKNAFNVGKPGSYPTCSQVIGHLNEILPQQHDL